jgi:hypothetical protein
MERIVGSVDSVDLGVPGVVLGVGFHGSIESNTRLLRYKKGRTTSKEKSERGE